MRLYSSLIAVCVLAFAGAADARIPRDVIIVADEQDADPETGVTIARGRAEIRVERMQISGRAETIEIRPKDNAVLFKGGAFVSVGDERFSGEDVVCTLDFYTCRVAAPSAPIVSDHVRSFVPPAGVGAAATLP